MQIQKHGFIFVSCNCVVSLKHTVGQKMTSGFINVHAVDKPEHRYTRGEMAAGGDVT